MARRILCASPPDKVPVALAGQYLSGKKQIPVPGERRKPTGKLTVLKAAENNLKNINVDFPLGVLTCVSVRCRCEQIPDLIKHARICGRVGTRRPPDRRLVNANHFIELLNPFNPRMFARM